MTQKLLQVGGGVDDESHFFGREVELRRVRQSLPSNCLVLGGRMQGKTSFLKAILRRGAEWGWDCHYIHAGNDFLARLERIWSLRKARSEETPRDPRFQKDRPAVVLVDEAEDLVGSEPEQRQEMFEQLIHLNSRDDGFRLCFVLAGGWKLDEAARDKPFDNFGPVIRIGALSNQAAEALVGRTEQYAIRYESSAVRRRIIEEAGRQAHLLCLLCTSILANRDDETQDPIRDGDVEKTLRSISDRFAGWRANIHRLGWPRWTSKLVERTCKREQTFGLDLALEEAKDADFDQVDLFLRYLQFQGWLIPTGRGDFYYLPLFRAEVLRQTRSIFQLSTEEAASRRFRVALSFPGEHRDLVQQVADLLVNELGAHKVFYDSHYVHELARPRLDLHLQDIFCNQSDLIVAFVGSEYRDSEWCGLEWDAIRDQIKTGRPDDIMIVRLDDGHVPGLLSTTGFIPAADYSVEQIAERIVQRLEDPTAPLPAI